MTDGIEYLIHIEPVDSSQLLTWWAESPQLKGWTAVADDLEELRLMIRESQAVFFEAPVPYRERLAGGKNAEELRAYFKQLHSAPRSQVPPTKAHAWGQALVSTTLDSTSSPRWWS